MPAWHRATGDQKRAEGSTPDGVKAPRSSRTLELPDRKLWNADELDPRLGPVFSPEWQSGPSLQSGESRSSTVDCKWIASENHRDLIGDDTRHGYEGDDSGGCTFLGKRLAAACLTTRGQLLGGQNTNSTRPRNALSCLKWKKRSIEGAMKRRSGEWRYFSFALPAKTPYGGGGSLNCRRGNSLLLTYGLRGQRRALHGDAACGEVKGLRAGGASSCVSKSRRGRPESADLDVPGGDGEEEKVLKLAQVLVKNGSNVLENKNLNPSTSIRAGNLTRIDGKGGGKMCQLRAKPL